MRVENDLKPHNVETIKQILEFYKTSNKCCAIQATGTGKTFLILRLLEIYNDMDKSAVIFAPNREIINQTKKRMKKFGLNNAIFYTYQKLARMTDEEIENINADLIVCDELHRTGAKTWGQKFEVLVETHSDSKVFGVTATPLRCADGRDMAEEYFDGNKACDISLAEALVRKIIPVMPVYVSALYTFEEEYKNMSDKIENARNTNEEKIELMKELKAAKQQLEKSNGIPEIIKKYITNYNGKYIVFCKDKKHLYAMKDVVIQWFRDAGYNGEIFDYPYYSDSNEVKRNLINFENNDDEGLKLLFVIDKLNEGLHLDVIHGCILLRTTTSNIIYYQQIGRAIDAGCNEKRVILDLVSNFNSLKAFNLYDELNEKIIEIQNGKFSECSEEFDIEEFHVNDYVQECVDVFNAIDDNILRNCDSWDNAEIDNLTKYFPTLGVKCKKYIPYRSEGAIQQMANALGINFNVNFFTDEDKENIIKYYPIMGTKCVKFLPNHTGESIKTMAYNLGVKFTFWNEEEDKIIIELYPSIGSKCINCMENTNKTKKQIMARARQLGVSKTNDKTEYKKWTKAEDDLLIDNISNPNLYKVFDGIKSPQQIERRIYKLGISTKSRVSNYKYVYKMDNNKWRVGFYINKKWYGFGYYESEDEAGKVAMEKAKEYGKI